MGTGWSQEEGSQLQPTRPLSQVKAEPSHSNHGHGHDETNSITKAVVDEIAAEAKPVQRNGVDSKSKSNNSLTVYAKDLSITWVEDRRYWKWTHRKDTNTSDAEVDVAQLLDVCWLEVHGHFDTAKLSPGIVYEIAFVIMIEDPSYGWDVPVNFRLTLPDGSKQVRKENLMQKQRGQWIEIPVGEFKTFPDKAGQIEFSLYEYEGGNWKRGLLIKGVAIRPKN